MYRMGHGRNEMDSFGSNSKQKMKSEPHFIGNDWDSELRSKYVTFRQYKLTRILQFIISIHTHKSPNFMMHCWLDRGANSSPQWKTLSVRE